MSINTIFVVNSEDKPTAQSIYHYTLLRNDVHVWCASLVQPSDGLCELLSQDERARADRFYFDRDRNRFILSRGLLRMIIGCYLDINPTQIQFCYGPHGKPALQTSFQNRTFYFNLSHSKDLVLFAFSWDHQVGIDIEYLRPISEAEYIADHFFSYNESTLIRTINTKDKLDAFFKIWTSKEAYLKATGGGLTESLSEIDISLTSTDSTHIESIDADRQKSARWHLETIRPASDYLATLAVEGHTPHIVFHQLLDQVLAILPHSA